MRYRTSHETLTESQIKEQLNTLASSDLKFCFTTNYNTPSRHMYKSTMLFFEKVIRWRIILQCHLLLYYYPETNFLVYTFYKSFIGKPFWEEDVSRKCADKNGNL